MQTVTILRQLWLHRRLTAVAALVAVVAGLAIQSQRHQVGVATARILVDTPDSQVVDVAPRGSDTLGVRANLLANLMVDGVVKAAIAKRAGLRPDEFAGIAESAVGTVGSAPGGPTARVLRTQVLAATDGERLPIIDVETQGPNAAAATTLANASVNGLNDYLNAKASQDPVAAGQRLRVSGLGVAQGRSEPRGPKRLLVMVAVLLVFAAGCALILGVPRLGGALREQPRDGAEEQSGQGAEAAAAALSVALQVLDFGDGEANPGGPPKRPKPNPKPRTSRLTGRRAENATKVLEAMKAEGGRMFQADLGRAAGLSTSQRREALRALEQAGKIRLTGEARRNASGPPTKEWELVAMPMEAVPSNGQANRHPANGQANGHPVNGQPANGSDELEQGFGVSTRS
jgi:hypothetical protein